MKPFLVDAAAAEAITGGGFLCSEYCLEEDGEGNNLFADRCRIKLVGCQHYSYHLQCLFSAQIIANFGNTFCPFMDAKQCWGDFSSEKYGKSHFWSPEDYHNFAKAFLRSEKLVDAFLKPEFR